MVSRKAEVGLGHQRQRGSAETIEKKVSEEKDGLIERRERENGQQRRHQREDVSAAEEKNSR